ncbi:urea transporter [Streptomyces sp. UP1A-1]|nr:urea transporter [Streptomyces sp. UP1A-1]
MRWPSGSSTAPWATTRFWSRSPCAGCSCRAAPVTLFYALLGAATATVLTPAVAALLSPSGGHAFTWPFVLTTLGFLAAARSFPRLSATDRERAAGPPLGARGRDGSRPCLRSVPAGRRPVGHVSGARRMRSRSRAR